MECIKKIDSIDTYNIRYKAMYEGQDESFAKISNDEDGFHYGLFYEEMLVCVVSIFYKDDVAQLRKFATLPNFQNKGFGSKLLRFILEEVKSKKMQSLWCNARKEKEYFYLKFGFLSKQMTFTKNKIQYVEMYIEFQ